MKELRENSKGARTLKAVQRLIRRYKEAKPKELAQVGIPQFCPLCKIHRTVAVGRCVTCKGCPVAGSAGGPGCTFFAASSYRVVVSAMNYSNGKVFKAAKERSVAYERLYEIIQKWPAPRFTKRGWEYKEW